MNKASRVLLLGAFASALVFASCASEDDINAQTAGSTGTAGSSTGSGGSGTGTAGSSTGSAGTNTTGSAGTSTSSNDSDSGGCSLTSHSGSSSGGLALGVALALGLVARRRREPQN